MALFLRTYCRETRLDVGRSITQVVVRVQGKVSVLWPGNIAVTRTNQILDGLENRYLIEFPGRLCMQGRKRGVKNIQDF